MLLLIVPRTEGEELMDRFVVSVNDWSNKSE